METTQKKMNKPLKTAGALRASDTEFLHQDSMPKLMDEITKPKQSPVHEAALRAALEIINSTVNPAMRNEAVNCNSRNLSSIIACEFAFVDELVECLRACLDGSLYWHHGSCAAKDNLSPCNCWVSKSRALLERIEKGTK